MRTLIENATIINEGLSFLGSLLIEDSRISKIFRYSDEDYAATIEHFRSVSSCLDASGMLLLPGVIDDQVHFREPGATYKGDIASESAAAALGGVTSYMDMPNNCPPATTQEILQKKYDIAQNLSYSNYSFYLGATNDNLSEIIRTDPTQVCGVKVFMGSSTGNMLVDSPQALEAIFRRCPTLIATHCEEEGIIRENLRMAQIKYGEDIPVSEHPQIRSREGCISSTRKAIALALRYGTRLHVLHISTAEEVELLRKAHAQHREITFEICAHYLWFCDEDYAKYGTLIKCNPSIKARSDMNALRNAVKNGFSAAVATDHAPHLLREKQNNYLNAPSGLPSVEHSLRMMLQLSKQGLFTLEEVVRALSHDPAECFCIHGRGFIREGYYADLVLVNSHSSASRQIVSNDNIHYKCGWSPLEGTSLDYTIEHTFVNGVQVVKEGTLTGAHPGQRLQFER